MLRSVAHERICPVGSSPIPHYRQTARDIRNPDLHHDEAVDLLKRHNLADLKDLAAQHDIQKIGNTKNKLANQISHTLRGTRPDLGFADNLMRGI